MARYRTFEYGTQTYGGGRGITRSSLLAQAIGYSVVALTISTPTRLGERYAIVRTYNGAAEHPSAGLVVSIGTVVNTEWTIGDGLDNLQDTDNDNDVPLASGWVYYTLFIFDTDGSWAKDAATSVLLPRDRGTLDYLIKAIPSVYTSADNNPITPHEVDSALMRFLSGFTLTYDELAGYVDSILPDNRGKYTIRRLHNTYAQSIGMPSEYTIGVAATARLHREGGYIYRAKGTLAGIETYVEALTGWQTVVTESPNIFLTRDDSSFERSLGNWTISGGTLTRTLVAGAVTTPADLFPFEDPISGWSKEAVGRVALTSSTATLNLPGDTDPLKSIPVQVGQTYRLEIPSRAISGSPTLNASIRWVDQKGALISSSAMTPFTVAPIWSTNNVQAVAPAGAVYAQIRITITGSSGNTVDLDMMSFSDTDDYIDGQWLYRDPRSVNIMCEPIRVNLLKDPSFEGAGGNWTATTGTFTQDVAVSFTGNTSGKLTGSPFTIRSNAVPVLGTFRYGLGFMHLVTDGSLNAHIVWLDDANNEVFRDSFPIIQGLGLYSRANLESSATYFLTGSASTKVTTRYFGYDDDPNFSAISEPYLETPFPGDGDYVSSMVAATNQVIPADGTYTVSGYFYVPVGSPMVGRTVTIADETGALGTTLNSSTPATLVGGSWVRAVATYTYGPTANRTRGYVARYSGATAIGDVFYTDAWDFNPGYIPKPLAEIDTTPVAWTRANYAVSCPAGATKAFIEYTGSGVSNIDAAIFERSDKNPVFFSGAVADSLGADGGWSGEPANSYSVLYPNRPIKLARLIETLDYYLPNGVTWRVLLWDSDDPEVQRLIPNGEGNAV